MHNYMFTAITAIPIVYGTSKHSMYYTGREGAARDGGGAAEVENF